MKTETILELIEKSELPVLNKTVLSGFIQRVTEDHNSRQAEKDLIESIAGDKVDEVVLSLPHVKIYTVQPQKRDEWTVEYPYRSIYLKEEKWLRTGTVAPTMETAFLVYLGHSHLGPNSRFEDFATKMLNITV